MTPVHQTRRVPPIRAAWRQAIASIRVRFWRHALTTVGVGLSAAFLAGVLTLRAAELSGSEPDRASAARLTWLAATALLMCLAGVTNAMLLSVAERTREIGTIKCLGATDAFIVQVYFLESVLLGTIGSLAGAVFGAGLMCAFLVPLGYEAPWGNLPAVLGWSTLLCLALTSVSALVPALHAARLPASAAMRVEV
jgi:putative ABC transport system permease protein